MQAREVVSRLEFERLSPYLQGWMVGLLGGRKDHPHIPTMANPYPSLTMPEFQDWQEGWLRGTKARRR